MNTILTHGRHVPGRTEVEWLIVGGGSAGCVLAAAQRHRPRTRAVGRRGAKRSRGVGFSFEATERLQREAAAFERKRPLYMAQVTIEARSAARAEGVCDLFVFPAIDPPGEPSPTPRSCRRSRAPTPT
jgi:hypothetical protein